MFFILIVWTYISMLIWYVIFVGRGIYHDCFLRLRSPNGQKWLHSFELELGLTLIPVKESSRHGTVVCLQTLVLSATLSTSMSSVVNISIPRVTLAGGQCFVLLIIDSISRPCDMTATASVVRLCSPHRLRSWLHVHRCHLLFFLISYYATHR